MQAIPERQWVSFCTRTELSLLKTHDRPLEFPRVTDRAALKVVQGASTWHICTLHGQRSPRRVQSCLPSCSWEEAGWGSSLALILKGVRTSWILRGSVNWIEQGGRMSFLFTRRTCRVGSPGQQHQHPVGAAEKGSLGLAQTCQPTIC